MFGKKKPSIRTRTPPSVPRQRLFGKRGVEGQVLSTAAYWKARLEVASELRSLSTYHCHEVLRPLLNSVFRALTSSLQANEK